MIAPEASVILPTFNRDRTLGRAIESVLRQSYTALELLVVDDGSTDTTAQLVAAVADPRVTYVRLSANAGVSRARNVGVRRSRGSYVAFIDSDDIWLADKLRIQIDVLRRQPEVGVVYCDMIRVGPDGSESYHRSPDILQGRLTNPDTGFFQPYGLGAQSVVVRRSCFEQVGGYDETIRCFEDLELFVRLSRVCRFHHVESALVEYRYSDDGLTQIASLRLEGRRRLFRLYWKDLARESPAFFTREAIRLGKRTLRQSLVSHRQESTGV